VQDELRAALKPKRNIEWARPTKIIMRLPAILEPHIQLLLDICQSVAITERICYPRQCRWRETDYVQEPMRRKKI
jgi:hypothetical protein